MITRTTILRAGLLAAYFSTWGWSGYEPGKLLAQADALIIGNEHIIFPEGGGAFGSPSAALPAHPLGTPNAYHGEIPMQSQHIRSTGDGHILFFEVNGNVYDGNGWLIADARGTGCTDCVESGVMEFISIPVPGECGLFYLLSVAPRDNIYSGTHIQWSVLDMNQDNLRFPATGNNFSKKGRLLDMYFDPGTTQPSELVVYYPQFQAFNEDVYLTFLESTNDAPLGESMNSYEGLTSTKVARLFSDLGAKDQSPQIRVVAPSASSDGFIFLSVSSRVYVYRVTDHGIYSIHATPENWFVPLLPTTSPVGSRKYDQDTDAIRTANGIAFAMNGCGLRDYPTFVNTGILATMLFNSTTGQLIPNSVKVHDLENGELLCQTETSTEASGIFGCAFRPDGLGVYVTGSRFQNNVFSPYLGHIDLVTNTVLDRSSLLPAGTTTDQMRQRLYHGKDPISNNDALFLPKATGINVISNIATPNLTSWNGTLLMGNVQNFVSLTPITQQYMPYYINDGISGDAYLSAPNRLTCCSFLGQTGSGIVEGLEHTGTASWSDTNNPYGNASTLTFNSDLVVMPGAKLTLNNMTFRFAPGVRVIVERGGYLDVRNTILTSLDCPNSRWRGVEVRGTISLPQTWAAYPTNQGRMNMVNNSSIENAEVGVLLGATQTSSNAQGYSGGILNANGSSFINCIEGVRMMRYQNFAASNPGNLLRNRTNFIGVTFTVNALYPQPYNFKHHVYMNKVSGITFTQCQFKNEWSDTFFTNMGSRDLGYGIYSMDADFKVQGGCTGTTFPCPDQNVLPSTFEGLDHGIHAMGSATALRTFTSDHAQYTNNICGIYTSGVVNFVAKKNKFNVGGRNVTLTNPIETPAWDSHHRGLYSYNGYGFIVEDNSVLQNGPILAEGIVIGYSREHSDMVFRNDVSYLDRGYIGEGQCVDLSQRAIKGLHFQCNDNTDNRTNFWSRIVVPTNGMNETIRTQQGLSNRAADNTFDRDLGRIDFANDGCANNTISYWWAPPATPYQPLYVSVDPVTQAACVIASDNVNGIPVIRPTDNCLFRTVRIKSLNPSNALLETGLDAEKLDYANNRYLYGQLLDGGDRDEILGEISAAWPNEAWDLRAYLLDKSPYLSVEVLKGAMDKPGFPMAMKAEVCIANPDATQKEGFLRWLQYEAMEPMPQSMIDNIIASWNTRTYRTVLENTLAYHHSEMTQVAHLWLEKLGTDTVNEPLDSLRIVWQKLRTPGARYAEAISYMQTGEWNAARTLIENIPAEHQQKGDEIGERGRMIALIDLLETVALSGRHEDELTVSEQDGLEQLMAAFHDRPATWAQNLLCFHYERCTPPVTGGTSEPKSAALDPSRVSVEKRTALSIQPNPAETWAAFNFDLDVAVKDASIVILDAQGRTIDQMKVTQNTGQLVWDTRQIAPGLYTAQLMNNGRHVQTEKLIVKP